MSVRSAWRAFRHELRIRQPKVSFSQCGEDLIASFVLKALGCGRISYLDIGAHHPVHISNTYRFYLQGGRGVLVEPDPDLAAGLRRTRPGDRCLQAGVAAMSGEADFFRMDAPSLNTFSRSEAEALERRGTKIREVCRLPVMSPADLIRAVGSAPDFVSMDVEGLDGVIVAGIDWTVWRPLCVCVETLRYRREGGRSHPEKDSEIAACLKGHGYLLYADTFINTLFVDEARWLAHVSNL